MTSSDPRTEADICLILEGAYPFVLGGVSSWTHALIEAAPHLSFQVVALTADSQVRKPAYVLPPNVRGVTTVPLDGAVRGARINKDNRASVSDFGAALTALLETGDLGQLEAIRETLQHKALGREALLDSREAWTVMTDAYERLLPNAPLVEFFWTWRVLARSVIALLTSPLPRARAYHAISTGYAGLYAARAKLETRRPVVITEHGIYTNERRIEIALADWLYSSGRAGLSVSSDYPELRDLWQRAFSAIALVTYEASDLITTLYEGNQHFQLADGAASDRLRVIPNGVDYARFSAIERDESPRKPTLALIGRVVPIKDIRTFIFACAALKRRIPEFEALIMGPEDEDAAYAAECRALVEREGLTDSVKFLGRVNVKEWLGRVDVVVLSSISEAQPLVLLEAGAAGVPSVTTDVGSCREMIEGRPDDGVEGAGGMVVRVGDSAGIADAVASILSVPGLREKMGETIRRRVKSRYNKVEIDLIYNDMYADMMTRDDAALFSRGS